MAWPTELHWHHLTPCPRMLGRGQVFSKWLVTPPPVPAPGHTSKKYKSRPLMCLVDLYQYQVCMYLVVIDSLRQILYAYSACPAQSQPKTSQNYHEHY